ncbi:hypothetical protein CRG98_037242 [Punica granatum]|uniref:Uncharacterized protein n=1 Tax=Punica granatum TaxID=22663 RepID=A0A2I0IED5_PUNGR|nr:hypothetical protein CRG98_037242 [Punica granatum]
MVGTQCIYAGIALFSRTAFLQGMKPPIFLEEFIELVLGVEDLRNDICSRLFWDRSQYELVFRRLVLVLGCHSHCHGQSGSCGNPCDGNCNGTGEGWFPEHEKYGKDSRDTGVGAALTFFRQTWCISQRGPVLSAMFSPLNTVLATNFASIFLHEEINIGRVIISYSHGLCHRIGNEMFVLTSKISAEIG